VAIRCPQCGFQHDAAEFEGTKKIKCRCGFKLDLSLVDTVEDFLRYTESEDERKKAIEIQRGAQVVCLMILDENTPEVDIEIAKGKLKEKVQSLFPDKVSVYEMIYESRFKRLWEQFRQGGPGGGSRKPGHS